MAALSHTGYFVILFRVIRSTLLEGHAIIGDCPPMYYLYNMLLITLQVLHIIWFYMICKMVYLYIVTGKVGWKVTNTNLIKNTHKNG